jgi:hypothetical protein
VNRHLLCRGFQANCDHMYIKIAEWCLSSGGA